MVMANYVPKVYKNDDEPFLEADNLNPAEQQLKKLTDAMRNVQVSLESGETAQAIKNLNELVSGLQAGLDKKLDKTANAVSATKLKTARKINGVDFDGSKDIVIPAEDMGYQVFKPTLLGTWQEHPTFGECLAVKVGRSCTLSGWLTGGDPWDDKSSRVLQLPTECRPTRDIFVNVSTKGAMMSAMIMHESGELWLIPSDSGERPSISSDMAAFTVTYVIIDA